MCALPLAGLISLVREQHEILLQMRSFFEGNEGSAGTPLHTPRLEHAGAASAANTPGVRLANGNANGTSTGKGLAG